MDDETNLEQAPEVEALPEVEEEIEEVVRLSGSSTVIGFYSNGEIAPPTDGREFAAAVLHNQTMTVTTISER